MKALFITEQHKMAVQEIEKPIVGKGELLLEIHYVGFCGSDLNTYRGLNPMVSLPIIPGHEIGAKICEIDSDVPSGLFCVGDIVTINPYTACGSCASCRNQRENACRYNQTLGVQRHGAMKQYLAVPYQKIIKLDGIDTKTAALIEPLSVGFHAVDRANVADNEFVVVIGCGMVGLGSVLRASLRGSNVIAIDIDDQKLDIAKQMGARYTINSVKDDVCKMMSEITDDLGADVVIEAVGSPQTYVMAIDIAGFTSRVVCIGYAKSDVSFQTKLFVQKEIDIRGSRNALPSDFRAVINAMKIKQLPIDKLISNIVPLENAQDAMQQWEENVGKTFRILVNLAD